MNKIYFTITIDSFKRRVETWCQQKEKLPPEQERRFEELKKSIDRIVREFNQKQPQLIE